MNNLKFKDNNLIGEIKSALVNNLVDGESYSLCKMLNNSKTGYSRCLSTSLKEKIPVISETGNKYFIVFRIDFGDKGKYNDPCLDLDLYDVDDKYLKISKQKAHHTPKEKNKSLITYKVEDHITYKGDKIPLNFEIMCKMTIIHEMRAKANIAKE